MEMPPDAGALVPMEPGPSSYCKGPRIVTASPSFTSAALPSQSLSPSSQNARHRQKTSTVKL